MHIFFCENLDSETALLSEEESKHAIQVLRLRNNDAVHVIDGKGKFCDAIILDAHSKKCELKIENCKIDFQKHNYHFHIAIAPTKQMERYEWFIEKAVELGVDEITPLLCHDSVRTNLRIDRLQKVILSAVKQSIQAHLPKLNEAISFNDFAKKEFETIKMIAHCDEGNKKMMQDVIIKKQNALLLIGPEGDFTPNEISLALQNNFEAVSLGETRLRTETAGVYACSVMRMING
ncbi:MAG: 16S rRNA (uracil(1498)-N(3))-methyltransferase [Bacteroidia bacterium]